MAKKILLVDDSSTARLASRMLFVEHKNYELISACDGKEGIETAIREQPDLILLDIEMPRMNGLEACKVLKENANTKRIPVILLTMRRDESDVQKGYASGCNDFLTKPVNGQKLAALIKSYLGE